VNPILDAEKAKQYGIDRVPAIAIVYEGSTGTIEDSHIRFLGAPSGYEFMSLVQACCWRAPAIDAVGGEPQAYCRGRSPRHDPGVHDPHLTALSAGGQPRARDGVRQSHITAYAVEATSFPDLARRYHVSGVPKTVVNEDTEILGALPEELSCSGACSLRERA